MKLLLLKTLLQRRARDEGFTLPMVIALGLVMILLGATSIVKSNEENIAAINTNSSSDALAIAEVGVARYRELLNQNRILTIYNGSQWSTLAGRTCNNIANTPPGWFDDNDDSTNVSPTSDTQWWEVKQDKDDDSLGEYKLVSYVYDNDDNLTTDDDGEFAPDDDNTNTTDSFSYNDGTYNTRGILTVQGRSSDGSEAQIQVEVPLRTNDIDEFKPVLWVGNGAITNAQVGDAGDLTITDGNIILSNPGTDCPGIADIDGNNVINDPRELPGIIPNPGGVTAVAAVAANPGASPPVAAVEAVDAIPAIPDTKQNKNYTINRSSSGTNDDLLLPIPQSPPENKGDDGRFLYVVTSDLILNDNDLQTDGAAKVTLYLDNQSIDIDGNVTLGNFNLASSNVSSQNLEIYVAGNQTIDINPGGGIVNIEAFIHAPNSTLEISGSGTVNINGAVWVDKIDNSGKATINITGDKTSTVTGNEASYKFYSSSKTRTPRPITGNPTNWVREEVD